MKVTQLRLSPPFLEDIAQTLAKALPSNYITSSATVTDLRQAPFKVTGEGLTGSETAADIGGQVDLLPQPYLHKTYSLIETAKLMGLSPGKGAIIGAGAGPFLVDGTNSELAHHLSWGNGFDSVTNLTRAAQLRKEGSALPVCCPLSGSTDSGLMMNLYGSKGLPGPVIKPSARGRQGDVSSCADFIRQSLAKAYGVDLQVSLRSVFIIKSGKAKFHVIPPFPKVDPPPFKFRNQEHLDGWLSYHTFGGPMIRLAVLHCGDPEKIGIRLEHTHCYSNERGEGAHYHYDLQDSPENEEVEYERYFNTIKTFHQINYARTD
ncbi:uncharacterized protein NECHADRAFT_88680 [Fusarium vanettenii 77-13-4]|uniref:DUF1907 domain-containing protein n=1 Tax=Fusarium vanettenii (strain ATCC MYA-4622 / CBS 123669 / FGSC 9596 / NRRL 45880 / 77-13-4) TaxID=660122 RepID=C7ZLH7_FUSV7|nr:uncharacterized protein NECHADRAFT_88680 [Fusarium vanettenii 77-13-4]EEU35138.1 hypothetical protein NECHADRAFT_88680 [Fusarium vanettenii 77-13-4]